MRQQVEVQIVGLQTGYMLLKIPAWRRGYIAHVPVTAAWGAFSAFLRHEPRVLADVTLTAQADVDLAPDAWQPVPARPRRSLPRPTGL